MSVEDVGEAGAERLTMTAEERSEEQKLIRRLQMMMNMVMQVIAQDANSDGGGCVADDRGQPPGGAGDVSGQGAGVRPDLAAAVSAADAGAVPDHVVGR